MMHSRKRTVSRWQVVDVSTTEKSTEKNEIKRTDKQSKKTCRWQVKDAYLVGETAREAEAEKFPSNVQGGRWQKSTEKNNIKETNTHNERTCRWQVKDAYSIGETVREAKVEKTIISEIQSGRFQKPTEKNYRKEIDKRDKKTCRWQSEDAYPIGETVRKGENKITSEFEGGRLQKSNEKLYVKEMDEHNKKTCRWQVEDACSSSETIREAEVTTDIQSVRFQKSTEKNDLKEKEKRNKNNCRWQAIDTFPISESVTNAEVESNALCNIRSGRWHIMAVYKNETIVKKSGKEKRVSITKIEGTESKSNSEVGIISNDNLVNNNNSEDGTLGDDQNENTQVKKIEQTTQNYVQKMKVKKISDKKLTSMMAVNDCQNLRVRTLVKNTLKLTTSEPICFSHLFSLSTSVQ